MNGEIINWLNNNFGYHISNDYYKFIDEWKEWWKGFYQPFHRITFENGEKRKTRDMYTMKMGKKVCEDWASILINDKTFVKLDDEYSETFIVGDTDNGGVFGSNNFWDQANDLMEKMMWSGTGAIVIRLKNAAVSPDGRLGTSPDAWIDLNYLEADKIIVLSSDNGIITEAAFCSDICIKGSSKLYLEIHRLENGEYIIENHIFSVDTQNTSLLREEELPEGFVKVMRTGSDKPWFSICIPAIVNPISGNNGMGCSVFAGAMLAKFTGKSKRQISKLYTEACKEAINNDAKIYRAYGKDCSAALRSVSLSNTLKAGIKNANGMTRNLTKSMVESSRATVTHLMDKAWLEVASGAFSPQEAIFNAVSELASQGIKAVTYPSGHTDRADVAVRRAVMTGISQTAGQMQLDLAAEMDCDLVEVTSHMGARPTHAVWQGKVYSISGKSKKYPPLSVTGYGTGAGLKGWNCRHDFFPFFEGISRPANLPVDISENNEQYALEQKQRSMERSIRETKRRLAAFDGAVQECDDEVLKRKLQNKFERHSAILKEKEKRLNDFCKTNGLYPQKDRVRVVGFGKSVSQKAVHGSKRYAAKKAPEQGISTTLETKNKPTKNAIYTTDKKVIKVDEKTSLFGVDKPPKDDIIESGNQSELGKMKDKLLSDDRMSSSYYNAIKDKFSHGSDSAKAAFNKFVPKDSVAESDYINVPCYDPKTKKIYMNYETDLNNSRGSGATWFHEHGHMIDDLSGKASKNEEFQQSLYKDYMDYMKQYGKRNGLNTFDKVQDAIGKDLSNMREHSAVSDILDGLSKGNIHGVAGHNLEYWVKNADAVYSEAFAHMFESQFDEARYNQMRRYFPNALKKFEDILEVISK